MQRDNSNARATSYTRAAWATFMPHSSLEKKKNYNSVTDVVKSLRPKTIVFELQMIHGVNVQKDYKIQEIP